MIPGKLSNSFLSELLSGLTNSDSRVILGPSVGEDSAVIDFHDRALVVSSDPVTFATEFLGWYLVQINANDVAVSGAVPKWFLATLLFPKTYSENEIRLVFEQVISACDKLNIALVGGHTEIVSGIQKPIGCGTMIGEAFGSDIIKTKDAQIGDRIVMTNGIAIEGTAILAREASSELLNEGINSETIERAASYLWNPGISVLNQSSIVAKNPFVTSMHDITEGGLSTALSELSIASNVGVLVNLSEISILPETRTVCDALGLNPLGLISSGALIATVKNKGLDELIQSLESQGFPAFEIGEIVSADCGLKLSKGNEEIISLPLFERDELARFYS